MKKRTMLLLLAGCLALGGCAMTATPPADASATLVPGTSVILPRAQAPAALQTRQTATLFFRYLDEPYLAPETRNVTSSPDQPFEMTLLTELLYGPGTRSADLTALFPEGTRVLSTVTQGRTVFVTLSREIMSGYPDEPADWKSDPALAIEVPLRRRLCMQSLVATLTENCDVDQVQILVEQEGYVSDSLRLKQSYFMDDQASGDGLTGPMTRQEELLLTPSVTLRVILSYWKTQNWTGLYKYLLPSDPVTGAERPAWQDFVTAMENLPRLMDSGFSGGSVSTDGGTATYTLRAVLLLSDGVQGDMDGRVIRLYREDGLWKISMSQLTGWLEEAS